MKKKVRNAAISLLMLLLIGFVIIIPSFIVVVDAGELGVVKTFGNVSDNTMYPGIHLKSPFSSVVKMSARTEEYTMSVAPNEGARIGDDAIEARASDGALVWLDVTVFYHIDATKAPQVYKELGEDYVEKVVRPEIRSKIREVVAQFPVIEIYSTKRNDVVGKIEEGLKTSLNSRGIQAENVLLRNVSLSDTLSNSIEEKLAAQQEAEKFDFVLEKETKEAERKRIEAEGQRDSQSIINQGLTTNYLYYLYIQSLKEHQGTIYVPTEGGLPLFKNVE